MIVDTFMWAGLGEKNLLLAKLNVEQNFVRHFVIAECAYSFKGTYKGLTLRRLIEEDPAFKSFREKITIIEIQENPIEKYIKKSSSGEYKVRIDVSSQIRHKIHYGLKFFAINNLKDFRNYVSEERERNLNRIYRLVEKYQRESTRPIIYEFARDKDFVFLSDIDEILDCDSEEPSGMLSSLLEDNRTPKVLHIKKRMRLWDWNNLSPRKQTNRLIQRSYLEKSEFSINVLRNTPDGYTIPSNTELVHEYGSCQPYDELLLKYSWYPDISPSKEELDSALKLNSELPQGKEFRGFCEVIEPFNDNQPNWVKDNLSWLRTGNINPNYMIKRQEELPDIF